jgi:hypothetical protein
VPLVALILARGYAVIKLIIRGVVYDPPADFVAEVLRLLGVESVKEITESLLRRLGFKGV